jgi:hypothetical protein
MEKFLMFLMESSIMADFGEKVPKTERPGMPPLVPRPLRGRL